ncbi:MAG: hypothetical protein WCI88_12765 [Chloroflexota bacterium]
MKEQKNTHFTFLHTRSGLRAGDRCSHKDPTCVGYDHKNRIKWDNCRSPMPYAGDSCRQAVGPGGRCYQC